MSKIYVIAIAFAAVVLVDLVVVIPNVAIGEGSMPSTASQTGSTSESARLPEGHPPADVNRQQEVLLDTAGALESAGEACQAKPKDTKTLLALGGLCLEAGHADDAAPIYKEALALDAKNSDVQPGLAMVDFAKGYVESAETKLLKIISGKPESQSALHDLSITCFSSNRREEARTSWQKVAEINPNSEVGLVARHFLSLMSNSESSTASPHGDGGRSGFLGSSSGTGSTTTMARTSGTTMK